METDAKGHADLSVDLPDATATRPLEAKLIVDVAEPGGRTVERTVTLPVRAKGVMVGVKKDFDETIGAGDVATFEAIAVAPDGARVERKGAEWSLYQVTNDYQWFNADGRWSFEPVKSSKRVASGTIDIGADEPAKFSAPVGWGAAAARRENARRRGDELQCSTSAGPEPPAPTRPTMSSSRSTRRTTRPATKRSCASIRPSPARRRSR